MGLLTIVISTDALRAGAASQVKTRQARATKGRMRRIRAFEGNRMVYVCVWLEVVGERETPARFIRSEQTRCDDRPGKIGY